MTGAVAIIAVTPHMPVPFAINAPSRFDCPNRLVKNKVTPIPTEMQAIMSGQFAAHFIIR